jgi:histidinol phosphatase-like enzyme (inositol monophosphatase family)
LRQQFNKNQHNFIIYVVLVAPSLFPWHSGSGLQRRIGMTSLQTRLDTAIAITASAAQISLGYFRRNPSSETKEDLSPVTVADTATERAIRNDLAAAFPDEPIFGEEYGASGSGAGTWIVDPIDGTRSFICGLPLFGMLLGYLTADGPQIGVIRMPALDEVYAGGLGIPATCNGTPIKVRDCRSLGEARLCINEADKLAQREPEVFGRLVRAGELRRMGNDCYPHALVARGLIDAVVDFDLRPYDFLPVSAVVAAAGGIMTDWSGQPLTMESDGRTLTAATPELHQELLALINRP